MAAGHRFYQHVFDEECLRLLILLLKPRLACIEHCWEGWIKSNEPFKTLIIYALEALQKRNEDEVGIGYCD